MERSKRKSRDQWEGIVAEQEKSGLSAKAFCKDRSIGLASFYQWRSRIPAEKSDMSGENKERERFIEMGSIDASDKIENAEASLWVVTLESQSHF